jgi:hypothetical protein
MSASLRAVLPLAGTRRLTDRRPWLVVRALRAWPTWLAAFYLLAGAYFVNAQVFIGDAVSRVAIARNVIQSYSPARAHVFGYAPHASAIGFVWGPLISMLEIPLVALAPIFPWLTRDAYAGVLVSAPFAAWGAWQFHRLLIERGVTRNWSSLLTIGFAFNPFILIYACNGMSEMPYVALLLATTRALSRWEQHGRTSDLAAAGCWLGLDYLVRYEALAAAVGGALFVIFTTFAREGLNDARDTARRANVNGLIFVIPIVFFGALFSGVSWWITGELLEQFSSSYGNSAQTAGNVFQVGQRVSQLSKQLLELAPLVPVIIPVGVALEYARRRTIVPVVAVVLGSPLLFDLVEISDGSLFDFTRFLILTIPISLLFLAVLREWGRVGFALATLGVVSMAAGAWVLTSQPKLAQQEVAYHRAILGEPVGTTSDLSLQAPRQIAAWFDSQDLPNGSILTDATLGFSIVLESKDPQRFVVPSFQAFQRYLVAPWQHGVRYLITVPPTGPGALDILNRYYPGLYQGCLDGTELALTADGQGAVSQWRVYRIVSPISPGSLKYDGPCAIPNASVG